MTLKFKIKKYTKKNGTVSYTLEKVLLSFLGFDLTNYVNSFGVASTYVTQHNSTYDSINSVEVAIEKHIKNLKISIGHEIKSVETNYIIKEID